VHRHQLILIAALVVFAPALARGQSAYPDVDQRIVKLLGAISEQRMEENLRKLVSFGTRNTMSDQASTTRGVGAARQWIFDQLKATNPRLQVSFDTHQIPKGRSDRITRDVELRNVVAILPGRTPRRVYVSGHYDTINLGAQGQGGLNTGVTADFTKDNADAPGMDDDGSGVVLMMELARVFAESGINFDATLVFTAVAGEEQGLIGAREAARTVKAQNIPVQAVFNNDIVGGITGGDGNTDGATIRLYSEGPEDSPSRALAMFIQRIGAQYVPSHRVRLMARRDRFGRGGDHTAWNLEGFTAVGFRESRENYAKQHNAVDIDDVSFAYLAQNARVNAAGMAVLALAPPPPVVKDARGNPTIDRRPSGYDAHLRWTASPGAAGYRIFWRDAWAPDWQHEAYVGNVTEYTLPKSNIDDFVFGVAAVDAEGHESTINAYVAAPATY
jgi:hypothetical protein